MRDKSFSWNWPLLYELANEVGLKSTLGEDSFYYSECQNVISVSYYFNNSFNAFDRSFEFLFSKICGEFGVESQMDLLSFWRENTRF